MYEVEPAAISPTILYGLTIFPAPLTTLTSAEYAVLPSVWLPPTISSPVTLVTSSIAPLAPFPSPVTVLIGWTIALGIDVTVFLAAFATVPASFKAIFPSPFSTAPAFLSPWVKALLPFPACPANSLSTIFVSLNPLFCIVLVSLSVYPPWALTLAISWPFQLSTNSCEYFPLSISSALCSIPLICWCSPHLPAAYAIPPWIAPSLIPSSVASPKPNPFWSPASVPEPKPPTAATKVLALVVEDNIVAAFPIFPAAPRALLAPDK